MPRPLLAGTADLEALGREARDIFDRGALEDQFHQRPANQWGKLVTGAAPAGYNGLTRQPGDRPQDEVVICHQIIRALVGALDIDYARILERRHTLVDEALHAGDRGELPAHVGRIVVADLDPRRLPLEPGVAVDAHVEVGEDRKTIGREQGALFGRRDQALVLARAARPQRDLQVSSLDTGEY